MAMMRTADIKFLVWSIVVASATAAFYAFYFYNGINFIADDGNYAQIAYELYLGREMSDLVIHYGVLWFKMGEALFHLLGVDFTWVRLIFIGSLIITVFLIFYTIVLSTGNKWLAAMLALAPIPATASAIPAIYGVCIMLNVAAQMRLACRMPYINMLDAAIAGAALSVTFQIRPDFGYVFLAPLLVILALGLKSSPNNAKSPTAASIFGGAMLGFTAAHMPIAIDAVVNGYMGVVIQKYLEYPSIMAEYFFGGIIGSVGTVSANPVQDAGTLLQRPALTDIFAGTARESQIALLTYGPVLMIAIYIAFNLATLRKRFENRQWGDLSRSLAALSAAAAFPHYFFFRPDLQHIANFMLGYMVLAASLGYLMHRYAKSSAQPWLRYVAFLIIGLLGAQITHLVWVGFYSAGNGAIAVTRDRPDTFSTPSIAHLNVTTERKGTLTLLYDIVQQNSIPGDRIVCVPYCPGVAFMNERQMFFNDFYVDDSFLSRRPEWIPEAIARTRQERPPVIIVMDAALNGTEISRFKNWAAPYVDVLEGMKREKIIHGGITVYLL